MKKLQDGIAVWSWAWKSTSELENYLRQTGQYTQTCSQTGPDADIGLTTGFGCGTTLCWAGWNWRTDCSITGTETIRLPQKFLGDWDSMEVSRPGGDGQYSWVASVVRAVLNRWVLSIIIQYILFIGSFVLSNCIYWSWKFQVWNQNAKAFFDKKWILFYFLSKSNSTNLQLAIQYKYSEQNLLIQELLLMLQQPQAPQPQQSQYTPPQILQQILDKVRLLCKQCNLSLLPIKISVQDLNNFYSPPATTLLNDKTNNNMGGVMTSYVNALDQLRTKIFQYRQLEQQYKKLESVLQKNETEIRKHIGVQQQFKLYIDTIKGQYEQSENDRLELLENSKNMIRQLKAENQRLCAKMKDYEEKGMFSRAEANTQKKGTTHHNFMSKNKDRVKSEYCSSLHIHHRHHTDNTFISPTKERLFKPNPHDFQIELTQRMENSKKKKYTEHKKKQNYTVMAYIGQNRKRESKDKNQFKKAGLLSFSGSNKKKVNFGTKHVTDYKANQTGNLNKSVFSLESIDFAKEQRPMAEQK